MKKQTTDNKQLTNDKNVNSQMSVVRCPGFTRAFTLIELIVVITIIAILVAAISVSWAKAQEKSRDARRKSDLKAVQQALDTYFETTGSFPSASNGSINCLEQVVSGTTSYYDSATRAWGTIFACDRTDSGNTDTFFQTFPKDPVYQSTAGYYYSVNATTGKSYVLSAQLENTNDPDIPASSGCQNGRNYCVKNQ